MAYPDLASSAAQASAAMPDLAPVRAAGPVDSAAVLQLILGLAFVIGLIFLLAYMVRRFSGGQFAQRNMKIVAALSVGSREKAVLIEVGGRQLLLGVAPGRVSLLQDFDEPVIKAEQGSDFASRLQEVMQRRGGSS